MLNDHNTTSATNKSKAVNVQPSQDVHSGSWSVCVYSRFIDVAFIIFMEGILKEGVGHLRSYPQKSSKNLQNVEVLDGMRVVLRGGRRIKKKQLGGSPQLSVDG